MVMKVKKFSKDLPNFIYDEKGDFVDLYINSGCICENTQESINETLEYKYDRNSFDYLEYKKGDVLVLNYGVAIQLPFFHEAQIRPRSSTFKNTGLLLTNTPSTLDESYKGDEDYWLGIFYATRDGFITRFDRLTQFKVEQKMVKPEIEYVEKLGNNNRGGYGSTGK